MQLWFRLNREALVKLRAFRAAALNFEEVRVPGKGYRGVPKLSRLFAPRNPGEDRAEEGRTVYRDHGCSDIPPTKEMPAS